MLLRCTLKKATKSNKTLAISRLSVFLLYRVVKEKGAKACKKHALAPLADVLGIIPACLPRKSLLFFRRSYF